MDEARSAGVRQEARLGAGKSSREIVGAAKEIGSTHRVYVKEWLIDARGDSEASAAVQGQKYAGRLHEDDIRTEQDFDGTWVLLVRKWNVHSEWKYAQMASDVARSVLSVSETPEGHVRVVARNSRAEHLLSQYGVLKLARK